MASRSLSPHPSFVGCGSRKGISGNLIKGSSSFNPVNEGMEVEFFLGNGVRDKNLQLPLERAGSTQS